jgi:hypothetical protein
MPIRFTNLRQPTRLDEFNETQRRQLEVCASLYFCGDKPLEYRFGPDDGRERFCLFELWDVEQDGEHKYDPVLYNGDSGTVFARGTTEVVAEMIQFHFDEAREPGLDDALQEAYCEATADPGRD